MDRSYSEGTYGPFVIALSGDWSNLLDEKYMQSRMTLRERLLKLNGVTGLVLLPQSGNGVSLLQVSK